MLLFWRFQSFHGMARKKWKSTKIEEKLPSHFWRASEASYVFSVFSNSRNILHGNESWQHEKLRYLVFVCNEMSDFFRAIDDCVSRYYKSRPQPQTKTLCWISNCILEFILAIKLSIKLHDDPKEHHTRISSPQWVKVCSNGMFIKYWKLKNYKGRRCGVDLK